MTSIWERLKQGLDGVVGVTGRFFSSDVKNESTEQENAVSPEIAKTTFSRYFFADFVQASSYAKEQALKRCESVKIECEEGVWSVLGDIEPTSALDSKASHQAKIKADAQPPNGREQSNWLPFNEWARLRDEQRRDADETNFRINERHREEREAREHRQLVEETSHQLRVSERSSFYRQLSKEKLAELWKNRESLNYFDGVEEEAVRLALREKLGITPTEITLSVCPRCLMVGDSCACHN